MRLSPSSAAAAALLVLPLVDAGTWNCAVVTDLGKEKLKYDFKELGGVHTVLSSEYGKPATTNITWQINPCGPIIKEKERKNKHQCDLGTQVCGVIRKIPLDKDGETTVTDIIPVASQPVNVKYIRLKDSDSPEDRDKDGLRVKLSGSEYGPYKQEVIIDFMCDMNRTGLEGEWKPDDKKEKRDEGDDSDGEKDDDKDGNNDKSDEVDEKDKPSLQFISYTTPEDSTHKLSLKWLTKYACEDYIRNGDKGGGDGGKEKGGSSHWGFFTWCFIILFLGVAAYLIFGSWLNYNRYGARGWDLLPHGDTIRDLPYLMKDFIRKVVSTLQGRSTRGGYSAV